MSIVPTREDEAYAKGLKHGFDSASELKWYEYPGSAPAPNGDGRCIVWIVTPDGMAYIGLRQYACRDDEWGWFSGTSRESGNVTHWMKLPPPPWLVGSRKVPSSTPSGGDKP